MARWWFFLVLLNFSSFSWVPSASSRAACSSSFSCSRRRLCLSKSWIERPQLSVPYSPPAQGFPQLPPEQPAAPPSLVLDDVSVCPSHGWSGLPRRADQVDP